MGRPSRTASCAPSATARARDQGLNRASQHRRSALPDGTDPCAAHSSPAPPTRSASTAPTARTARSIDGSPPPVYTRGLSVARRVPGHSVYRNFRTRRALWEDVPLSVRAHLPGADEADLLTARQGSGGKFFRPRAPGRSRGGRTHAPTSAGRATAAVTATARAAGFRSTAAPRAALRRIFLKRPPEEAPEGPHEGLRKDLRDRPVTGRSRRAVESRGRVGETRVGPAGGTTPSQFNPRQTNPRQTNPVRSTGRG
jgi:hypothetical protein